MARALTAVTLLALAALAPMTAGAHPLGNFAISQYSALMLDARRVELRYVVDMAEIPTFQELQEAGVTADATHASIRPYLTRTAERLKAGLTLEIEGRPVALEAEAQDIAFPAGAGGLPTLRVAITYGASIEAPAQEVASVRYEDTNFAGRAGWKEVIARPGAGAVIVASSVPQQDQSRELSDYPVDLLQSPPQQREASVSFARQGTIAAASATAPAASRQIRTPRDSFTELMATRKLSVGVVLFAALVALSVGALHALEPGHGKTVVAAYLVGSRGTGWHAILLGLIVTASHTVSVYLLGLITLYASHYILPERLYPWLGALSGLTIAGLGVVLFVRRYADAGARGHHHGAEHHHDHGHAGHAHQHGEHGHHHHVPAGDVSVRALLALGITGGIVPCPAALVVLLSAVAVGRIGFGFFLIVAFSVGLAAVLIAIGLLMVYARRFMSRFQGDGPLVRRYLPLTSAAVITVLGVTIAVQALAAAGIVQIRL